MRFKKINKRILLFLLSIAVILSFSIITPTVNLTALTGDDQEKIDSLKEESAELDKKIDSANQKIEELKDDKDKQVEYAQELQDQISVLQTKIDKLQESIDLINGQIDDKNVEIEQKELEIDDLEDKIDENESRIEENRSNISSLYDQLKLRLRQVYMSGGRTSDIETLLCSGSFETFLLKMQMSSAMTKHDNDIVLGIYETIAQINALTQTYQSMITQVEQQKNELEVIKSELKDKRAEVQAQEDEVADAKSEVDDKLSDVQSIIDQLDQESEEYQDLIDSYKREQKNIESEIDGIIAAAARRVISSSGSVPSSFSGGFICPLQYSNLYISSPFGPRVDPVNGNPNGYHGGTDICMWGGTYGLNISAAASGTVIVSSYHYSYGNYVVIQHSDSYQTLYAHCSRLLVSVGESVSQGETIALVGDTGRVTGPHLHFEIRVDGTRVNPMNYISL